MPALFTMTFLPPSEYFLGSPHIPECNDLPASLNVRAFRVTFLECVTTT